MCSMNEKIPKEVEANTVDLSELIVPLGKIIYNKK